MILGTARSKSVAKMKIPSEVILRQDDFQTVAENAADVICRFDKEYFHLYVNPAIEKATGIPPQVFVGKRPHDLGLPKRFADYWVKHLQFVLGSGEQTTFEFAFATPYGQRYFQSLLVPEFDTEGAIESVLSISRDITGIKDKEKEQENVVGIVSHELKTPIASLKAYTQVTYRRLLQSGDKQTAKQLEKMDEQINRLTQLIGDLLESTNVQSGNLSLEKKKFNVNTLVKEVVDVVQRSTKDHKIVIEGKAIKDIRADRNKIAQVLTNLLTNAVKYSPDAKKVIVRVKSDEKCITLCVQDFGIGIPKSKQKKIFNQFYRVSNKRERIFPGLGLGLYITAEIVRKHGGKIWVESQKKKDTAVKTQGSTFCITLPYLNN